MRYSSTARHLGGGAVARGVGGRWPSGGGAAWRGCGILGSGGTVDLTFKGLSLIVGTIGVGRSANNFAGIVGEQHVFITITGGGSRSVDVNNGPFGIGDAVAGREAL